MKSFKRATYKIDNSISSEEVIKCTDSISANGAIGIYEVEVNIGTELGYTGIQYDSYGIPDRFQIYYDGQLVADSKYVGSTSYFSDLAGTYSNVSIFKYQAGQFVDTLTTEEVVVTQSDISDGSPSYPTSPRGVISFNRTNRNSNKMKIRVTGVLTNTLWNLSSICPQDEKPTYVKSTNLAYNKSAPAFDCGFFNNNININTYYHIDDSIGIGTTIYIDVQTTTKAAKGYFFDGLNVYNYDGNVVTDILPCDLIQI